MSVQENRRTLRAYVSGFTLSIVLTLAAYFLAVNHSLKKMALIQVLVELAIVQFLVQMFFFLHLGRETKPRWKLLTVVLMIVFVLIVVLGSIWIMYNLNYRMSPSQMDKYMQTQSGDGL
jgi:cytochrome o ubiquinol oxidase operon protein cyoD